MTATTLETARSMETADLLASMAEGLKMAAEGIHRACVAIAVLEERDVELPQLPEVFRYAREIAEGRLSAHAGLILGRFQFAIKAVLDLPAELQDEVADGRRIKVATFNGEGRIVSRDLTIFEMSQRQMRLAFTDGAITPWEEQGEWLLKTQSKADDKPEPRKPKISVDAQTGDIVIGRAHVSVEDIKPALAALGYQLKPLYGSKSIKPAKVTGN